jgi:hypothetical protein
MMIVSFQSIVRRSQECVFLWLKCVFVNYENGQWKIYFFAWYGIVDGIDGIVCSFQLERDVIACCCLSMREQGWV